MAYQGIIYELGEDLNDNYPRINFSKQDSAIDWLAIDEMLYEKRPVDIHLLQSVDFKLGTKRKRFDILRCSIRFLFSENAKNAVVKMHLKGVRFVLTFVNGFPFYWFICENIIDCLDRQKSKVVLFDDLRVMSIKKYVFIRDNITDPAIFRIPERSGIAFLTQSVYDEITRAGLVGFRMFDIENPPPHEMIA